MIDTTQSGRLSMSRCSRRADSVISLTAWLPDRWRATDRETIAEIGDALSMNLLRAGSAL